MKGVINLAADIYSEDLYCISNQTLVVIPENWHNLGVPEKDLITRFVEALKQHFSVTKISVVSESAITTSLINQCKASLIISFGVPLPEIEDKYLPVKYHSAELILADSPAEMNQERKEKLWAALKKRYSR
ncbi:MAG: hypothetical protein L6Q51_07295 [Cyclobacteriaceae bacterium]|nr:hypothetical protein [Cyclobacteriaceae bacterium]